jgi:nucleotide-binding universal stress UspA family protein
MIVVGFVLRPEGRAALERAVSEARLRGSSLLVLHSMRGGERDEVEQVLQYRDALEEVTGQLEASGVDFTIREYVRGKKPAEDLLAVAEEEDAELIVIGLRRRSPVGKLVLGSHAQSVLLGARCPVLAVPATGDA